MKKWLLHIWIVGIFGMLTASCIMDEVVAEYDSQENNEKVFIRFTIALNEPTSHSRAIWEGYDPESGEKGEIGQGYENYINPNTVQVLLYDKNGSLMDKLKNVKANYLENSSVTPETEDPHVYALTGSFEAKSDEINNLSFKMMVFANCPIITDLDDFYNLTYSYEGWSLDKNGIPMWGIATYNNVTVYPTQVEASNHPLETPIYMLRSMAKIEVVLDSKDETDKNYQIVSAKLNEVLEAGMAVPEFRNSNDEKLTVASLEATTDLGLEQVFNPVAITNDNIGEGTFTEDEDNQGKSTYIIYVPEYNNNANNLKITLKLKDKFGNDVYKEGTTDYYFYHGEYIDGVFNDNSKMNVVRNHYYRYTVSMKDGRRLVLKLQVQPWNKVEEIWDYEETLTVTTSGKIQWDNTRSQSGNVVVINNEGSGQTTSCTFAITSPEEATWRAVLSPEHGAPQAFTFVTEEGEAIGMSTTGAVKDGPATLRIKPTNAVYAPNYHTARLLIYVDYKGRTQLANLMPDGSTEQYYVIRQNPQ